MSFSSIRTTVEQKTEIIEELDNGVQSRQTSSTKITESTTIKTAASGVVQVVEGSAPIDKKAKSATLSDAAAANSAETEDAEPGPMKTPQAPPGALAPGTTPPPWPNELETMASFNCIFTLGVLSEDEINNSSYRANGAAINILRSGGGITKPQTAVESALNINTEFFIDDVELLSVISPTGSIGNTNAQKIEFTVHEPYSMGLFAETLRIAAAQAGYKTHLNIPYLLTLEFEGWDQNNYSKTAPYSRRMLPINIQAMDMEVTNAGSVYRVTAIPYNEVSLGDDKQKLLVDTAIKGITVSEILQSGLESLVSQLNTREIAKEDTKQVELGDQYVIMFPKRENITDNPGALSGGAQAGATATAPAGKQDSFDLYKSISGLGITSSDVPGAFDAYKNSITGKINTRTNIGEAVRGYAEDPSKINDIGTKKIIEEWVAGGKHPMGKEGFALDKGIYKRGSVELQLSDDIRTFTFKQGTRIQDVIEEVILASVYAKDLDTQLKNPPADGMIDYFKIETQTYLINNNENLKYTGKYPKVHVYRIIPYKVHINIFKAPTSSTPGIREIKKSCAKQYEYIYTGLNTNVLNFDLKFNGFYSMTTNATNGSNAYREGASNAVIQQEKPEIPTRNVASGEEIPDEGATPVSEDSNPGTGNIGGSSNETIETATARFFNKTLLDNEAFLAKIDLEILGDPYWISDSGIGNYNAGDTSVSGSAIDSWFNMNNDGAVNSQNGDVHINVIFRTPIDYKPDGAMSFPSDTKLVYAFSGVYKVNNVVSSFSKNKFTQTLVCTRVLGQMSTEPASLVKVGDETNALVNTPGGVFDDARNVLGVDQNALDKLAANIAGASIADLANFAQSQIRQFINGLDPLGLSVNELANALGIDPSLITDDIFDQIRDGINPEDLGFTIPTPDLPLGLGDLGQIELDPLETLTNFAQDQLGN